MQNIQHTNKSSQIGALLLISGTCIGSGMIALPMVLANVGLIPSILLMLAIWLLMYYTSLINLELHMHYNGNASLADLAKKFSGPIASYLATLSVMLLSYALLAVFLYGVSSILAHLLPFEVTFTEALIGSAIATTITLLLPVSFVDYINRLLFIGLIAVVGALLAGLLGLVDVNTLPLYMPKYLDIPTWYILTPIVFTSFGFQGSFPAIVKYCKKDCFKLKSAVFFGTMIPAIIYIIWTTSVLSVVYKFDPEFYNQMVIRHTEVGQLVAVLSKIASNAAVQLLVWWISFFAIVTSVLGVGIGLNDPIEGWLTNKIECNKRRRLVSAFITVVPAYFIAAIIPNAFITVLGFAGMILAFIAILLPVFLLWKADFQKLYYKELKESWLICLSGLAGAFIVISEIFNVFLS